MRIGLYILISGAVLGSAVSARAESCSKTLTNEVLSGYTFKDDGSTLSDKPVNQVTVSMTCGKWTTTLFGSTTLSSKGTFGKQSEVRQFGDEIDLTVDYNDTIGPVDYELEGSYWVLADFGSTKDDVFETHAEASHDLKLGSTTITPYGRATVWFASDTTYFVRGGLRLSTPLGASWTFDADAGYSQNVTGKYGTTYGEASLTRDLGHNLGLSFGVKAIEHTPTVVKVGLIKTW
jgi:hypothetical protein